jgi:hypothetical protein
MRAMSLKRITYRALEGVLFAAPSMRAMSLKISLVLGKKLSTSVLN